MEGVRNCNYSGTKWCLKVLCLCWLLGLSSGGDGGAKEAEEGEDLCLDKKKGDYDDVMW